jgi:hypothetical protein
MAQPIPSAAALSASVCALLALVVGGCSSPDYAKSDAAEDGGEDGITGEDGEDGGSDGIEPPDEDFPVEGQATGTVTVELFGEDEDGERYPIDWGDPGFESWPFGPLFVAAYELDPATGGAGRYAGTVVINNPEMGTTSFELPVKLFEEKEVYLYAAIDVLGDGVIGSDDPRGVWPQAVPFADGHVESDVDITILAQAASDIICDGDTINITGEAFVTVDYWGGDISVMLLDAEGNGPLHVVQATEVNSGPGATTDYTLEICADYGEMQLISCWDSNLNGVFDGGDRWGVFSVDGQVNSNPVFVGNANMNNYPMWMPLGDRPGVDIIPFVTLRGSIGVRDGQLNSLPTGSNVHVVALKYRPNTGFDPTQGDISYDIESFEWSELSTATTLDWDLVVPSDTFVYLWAFADVDGDGMVNQSGEPIASGGTDENGKLPTGTSGFGGIDLLLSTVDG